MDKNCAPGVNFEKGSCINKNLLNNIVDNFNLKYQDEKIDKVDDKEDLVNNLEDKFKEKFGCNDQICWLNQSFVKKMKNKDLEKFTFRPVGPKRKLDWLSTTNINNVIDQYEKKHKDFIFLGAVPYDFQELRQLEMGEIDFNKLINGEMNEEHNKNEKISQFGMVINLDPHDKPGSHWVALYTNFDNNQIYFFDSFGKKPRKKIKKFINKIAKFMYQKKYNKNLPINKILKDLKGGNTSQELDNINEFDIRYNNIQHQIENTECGVYSINFIVRLVGGETFDEITKNITRDDFMNSCRKTYFRNKMI